MPKVDGPYGDTKVSAAKSQIAMQVLLKKHGIEDVQFTTTRTYKQIVFASMDSAGHMNAYRIRVVPKTDWNSAVSDQYERQALRMVYWWLKAQLEMIEVGLVDTQGAFLQYQLTAGEDGPMTMGERIIPQLRAAGTEADPFAPAVPALEGPKA